VGVRVDALEKKEVEGCFKVDSLEENRIGDSLTEPSDGFAAWFKKRNPEAGASDDVSFFSVTEG
jgi:hypothetical protein